MKCPQCGHAEDKVIDSRLIREGGAIRRRRECDRCGHRFTTYEYVEAAALQVIKRDGRREPFQRDKLLNGIRQALHKRPVSTQAMEELVDRIENELARDGVMELESSRIGESVMRELARIDQVAYIRFASVYKHFRDVQQFVDTIRSLLPEQKDDGGAEKSEDAASRDIEESSESESKTTGD
jgi:transcriptional repressor NrdR